MNSINQRDKNITIMTFISSKIITVQKYKHTKINNTFLQQLSMACCKTAFFLHLSTQIQSDTKLLRALVYNSEEGSQNVLTTFYYSTTLGCVCVQCNYTREREQNTHTLTQLFLWPNIIFSHFFFFTTVLDVVKCAFYGLKSYGN